MTRERPFPPLWRSPQLRLRVSRSRRQLRNRRRVRLFWLLRADNPRSLPCRLLVRVCLTRSAVQWRGGERQSRRVAPRVAVARLLRACADAYRAALRGRSLSRRRSVRTSIAIGWRSLEPSGNTRARIAIFPERADFADDGNNRASGHRRDGEPSSFRNVVQAVR